jgi:alginate O-acetyltransferase complex protein AlgI
MVFSSVMFLFRYLPIFFLIYFLVPGRGKNVILFLGSLIFYAWGEPVYVVLMLFSTVVDYVNGRLIGRFRGRAQAKFFLVFSVVINLFILCFFKYADFLIQTINNLTGASLPLLNLPLPIGISFYTFQTMSYTIDVYRSKAKVQKSILDFGVYVTMFPQLIAGPIVKYSSVEENLHNRKTDMVGISRGVKRFVAGLAKKALLANTIGELWAVISAMEFESISVFTAWIGIFAFAFQIYFDFSGYSDMAIGLGEIMGFHFPENFNYPYIASSITEFWRRWHISLGSWFREYVYIPLGGNRKGVPRQLLNILIVWTLTGIWHGAGWNFLLWGLWFAFLLMLEKLFLGKVLSRLPKGIGILYNTAAVLFGWVLFALESPAEIGGYLWAMFRFGSNLADSQGLYLFGEYFILFAIALIASTPLPGRIVGRLEKSETGWGIALYRLGEKVVPAILLLLCIAVIVDATFNPFLYFRF